MSAEERERRIQSSHELLEMLVAAITCL
jgi:hypothetical protein